jgi:penicillin-binding protein 1A
VSVPAGSPGVYLHALVTQILPYQVTARIGNQQVLLTPEDWAWTGFKTAPDFLHRGDIVYVHLTGQNGGNLRGTLEQDSGAQGSLLAMDNSTGDVQALVGGRDFNLSQFDRATQSERQTGSSFKPYVYTAAVEEGATPGEMILDAPTSFGSYTPHNYEGNYLGLISLEKAFADSRNIPALKLAQRVGIHRVIDTAHRFGITSNIPPFLPVALGSVEVTLMEHVAGYSVFPNDGIRIAPRLIRRVTTADGIPMPEPVPEVKEVISSKTARTMMVFLKSVMEPGGTGQDAAALHHALGGKTGTTSDFTDAWFMGFSPSVTCGVWIGYDNRQTLGDKETGAHAALPIWMDFMKQAVAGKPDEMFPGDMRGGAPIATRVASAARNNGGAE